MLMLVRVALTRASTLTRALTFVAVAGVVAAPLAACQPTQTAANVSMKFTRSDKTPRDAVVYIDEEFVGLLGVLSARGVRLPAGQHRITIERDGYFPWDALVESDGQPIKLEVAMTPIPD